MRATGAAQNQIKSNGIQQRCKRKKKKIIFNTLGLAYFLS